MEVLRTKTGLLVPVPLADQGKDGRPEGIPPEEWRTLSAKDRSYLHGLKHLPMGGAGDSSYMVINGPMPTTAAPSPVATGAVIKTMLQLKPQLPLTPFEWGISLDGITANTPGRVELIETDVTATVVAYAAADVMTYGKAAAPANTAGTSGSPLNLGTAQSGYTASAEGTTTVSRVLDLQQDPPTWPYIKQFPLGREPEMQAAKFTRSRVTFGTTVNAYTYVVFEI